MHNNSWPASLYIINAIVPIIGILLTWQFA